MIALTDIERAIEQLPEKEFSALRRWFLKKDDEAWQAEIEADSASGRLDFLFAEAECESSEGKLREWPPRRISD